MAWISALVFALAALSGDLERGKICHWLLPLMWAEALALRLFFHEDGKAYFSAVLGAAIPVVLFWPFFRRRMTGGGDVKLLSGLSALFGAGGSLSLLVLTLLSGSILSLFLMLADGSLRERLNYFGRYAAREIRRSGIEAESGTAGDGPSHLLSPREPYRRPGRQKENFHFTVPVLMGVMLYGIRIFL